MNECGNEHEMFLMMACVPIPSLIVSQAFVKVKIVFGDVVWLRRVLSFLGSIALCLKIWAGYKCYRMFYELPWPET